MTIGQVFREPEDFGGMNAAMCSEAQRAVEHGRAGHPALARLLNDHLVQGTMMILVARADKDSEQFALRRKMHMQPPLPFR
jgi:hypothetical protein